MIINAPNRRANYYVYDAIDPKAFASKEDFCSHVEKLYLKWQEKYLD
jgi:1-acyl-sn-glycerol-3-phosphate acyltransferase